MKYQSVFDIIGPVMVGPSSSHTAGAIKISNIARGLFGKQPQRILITLYGSFAKTYKGHGTDVALIGGLLNFSTDDSRIKDSMAIAESEGIEVNFIVSEEKADHPNTARIYLEAEEEKFEMVGISIGGGKVNITEINGYKIKVTEKSSVLLVFHEDRAGLVAAVANVLGLFSMNIGYMEVARKEKGSIALMLIETDNLIHEDILLRIKKIDYITNVMLLNTD